MGESTNRDGPKSTISILAIGLCLGIGTGLLGYRLIVGKLISLIPSVKVNAQSAPGAIPPNARGPAAAPITLEEFSDFECPPCKNLYGTLKRIEAEYGTQVRVIFRQYPIPALHKNAMAAARACEAAGLQGHFWEMHDRLFENQQTWASAKDARPIFAGYAKSLQLDPGRFMGDIDGTPVRARILADQKRAESIRVPGTPVVLVNAQQVAPQDVSYEGIRAAIERQLGRKAACSGNCRAPAVDR